MTKQSVSGHSAHFLSILAIFRGLLIYCDTFFSKKIPSSNAVKRPQKGIYMVKKIKIFQFKWISKLLAKPSVSK